MVDPTLAGTAPCDRKRRSRQVPGRPLTKANWSRSHIYKPLLKLAPALPACPEPKGRLAARPRAASLRVRPSEAAPLQLFAGLLAAPLDLRQQREAAYRA